jgi:hypothetical protein
MDTQQYYARYSPFRVCGANGARYCPRLPFSFRFAPGGHGMINTWKLRGLQAADCLALHIDQAPQNPGRLPRAFARPFVGTHGSLKPAADGGAPLVPECRHRIGRKTCSLNVWVYSRL